MNERRTWGVADWHLGEPPLPFRRRPFASAAEALDTMRRRHNELVAPDDLVYHLGDVCGNKTPEFLAEVASFNGLKILLRGNHDRVFSDAQLAPYFLAVYPEGWGINVTFGSVDCHLNHYPTQGRGEKFNLVGHVHDAWKFQLNMLNLGVDVHHFRPINLTEQVPLFLEAISKYYDEDIWAAYVAANADWRGRRGAAGSYLGTLEPKA